MEILKETGIIIFIDRPIQKILEDININSRPLLKTEKIDCIIFTMRE